jgi:diaminohydroxyphosphoribosylaminopyrimidine deaminase/5-amino-6-(5-phosphoribosylamino)uracil reductase
MSLTQTFSPQDAAYMARAFALAEKGQYSTTPNPCVGCVIVSSNDEVVGEGFHIRAGTEHAEVHALKAAGERSKASTAYVTLEPCSHHGKTPPCALALIEAGITRVVVAASDPNPLVCGRGIKLLEDAGIKVDSGLMPSMADHLNKGFNQRMRRNRPYVVVKLAASLDGKTALQNGKSQWITSAQARADVQIQRAKACAILSGSGTVLADNPSLNVRPNELPSDIASAFLARQKQPVRVLVDGKNLLHSGLKLFQDGHPNLVYNLKHNAQLNNQHTLQVQSSCEQPRVNLENMLDDLAQRDINYIWVEAGAKLAGALFENQLVDECVLYLAPIFLGGGARELLSTPVKTSLEQALSGEITSVVQVGSDIKLTCKLHK